MANPRDLAAQAFALLQDALRDTEARASELDEQLKRKRAPKNRLEEQLEVLTHRLEKIEAERAHWERQAGHLEEVAEEERVKVAQLKKKLEIAESGPEKLTKKEVNYWRERAETFDSETQEYKNRLASLRRELIERDAQLSQLQNLPPPVGSASEAPAPEQGVVADELRRQIEQRDQWLADLRLELHDLRTQASGTPEPPLETLAEIETLRHQVANLDRALADAHNTRAAAQADLHHAQQDLAARERAVRGAEAAAERAQALLRERDHRLVELSAELEQLRSDLHQREHHVRAESAEHADQMASLSRELAETRASVERLEGTLAQRERELAEVRGRTEAAAMTARDLEDARAARTAAEQRLVDVQSALERVEATLAERTRQQSEASAAVERLEDSVGQRERELETHVERLRELGERLAAQNQRVDSLSTDLERANAALAASRSEITSLRETMQVANGDLDRARAQVRELESAHAETLGRADALAAELAAANGQLAELDATQTEARRQTDTLEDELAAAREQIAGLEAELKEEKEHAENLGELANERREHMTKLQEQLEEAEERYAEADWRLGKALYFEKLVKRRKGLIANLIATLRAKMKANVALKAGLDGLRTFKASAEANQQKMLQRLDALKAELSDAEETIKKHQGATHTKEDVAAVEARAAEFESRLNTQAEIIQSLEAELKTARLAHPKGDDETSQQLEQLRAELETKNQIIARLQEDTDEQQRTLSKRRGSESETMRLKAMTEKDRGEIDALQREVAQLREALARHNAAAKASGSDNPELAAMLKERDQTVTRLMGTLKEHEATIKKLNESAEGWKRKYQFLATSPRLTSHRPSTSAARTHVHAERRVLGISGQSRPRSRVARRRLSHPAGHGAADDRGLRRRAPLSRRLTEPLDTRPRHVRRVAARHTDRRHRDRERDPAARQRHHSLRGGATIASAARPQRLDLEAPRALARGARRGGQRRDHRRRGGTRSDDEARRRRLCRGGADVIDAARRALDKGRLDEESLHPREHDLHCVQGDVGCCDRAAEALARPAPMGRAHRGQHRARDRQRAAARRGSRADSGRGSRA
jgi:chromosome segregation ATPase